MKPLMPGTLTLKTALALGIGLSALAALPLVGLLLLSTHGFWPYHPNPCDYWRWTAAGLRTELANAGWETTDCLGILGLASAALCLLQDAVVVRLPRILRPPFTVAMQGLTVCADRFYDPAGRAENATLYLIAARPAAVSLS